MALYAIADLHLATSESVDKPMGVFGEKWADHDKRIKENWLSKINDDDCILIPGDISWGMKKEEGLKDIEWIHNLPGRKILVKGNHDYWWSGITALNKLYDDMDFIQNNFFTYENYAICGTRGWICPDSSIYDSEKDDKIFNRELQRMRLSLDSAVKAGYDNIIVMMHYPPTSEKFEESEFIKIFKEYGVEKVLYGHLHGKALNRVLEGQHFGLEFIEVSADYLEFNPKLILD